MTLDWEPVTVEGFTVREVPEAELWSVTPGDATAETIVEEGAWEGAAAGPESGRAMLERWREAGAWVLGLYAGDELIGLYDVGRFVPADYLDGPADGAGDLLADRGPAPVGLTHLTAWFGIRAASRGRIPGPVLDALSRAFLRHLWDRGIREMVTIVVRKMAEGLRVADGVQRRGWHPVRAQGESVVMAKSLRVRP